MDLIFLIFVGLLCRACGYNSKDKLKIWRSLQSQNFNSSSSMKIGERMLNEKKSVFVSYANNPFGPSERFVGDNIRFANTFPNSTLDNRAESPLEQNEENTWERSKRGVIHLYNMVSCATGCDPVIYKGYGCFCGFLGSGYPVDGIDRCCKKHDWCYNRADCPMFLEYFVPYYWKCYYGKPLCALNQEHGTCARRLCECDRLLSECLSRYRCPSSRAFCRSSPIRLLQNAFMIF